MAENIQAMSALWSASVALVTRHRLKSSPKTPACAGAASAQSNSAEILNKRI
jgi:hypothetical protein